MTVLEADIPLVRMDHGDPELMEQLMGAVRAVAGRGAFTLGEEVEGFEREFAQYCGTAEAVGVSSGTDALALALMALGVGPGDEVIVPANSFIASAEAVTRAGARPRLVDVDPDSGLLTADLVEAAIGPRTRAVMPVHLYGATVDMDPLLAVARRHDLAVVEDACQAHGAIYRGRRAGSIGDAGCFSFYPTKNLGAWGDGGAVTTSDRELAARVRLLRSHGERPRYVHRVVGTTARLHAVQAAVLRVKLRRLEESNRQRRAAAAVLRDAIEGAPVALPAAAAPGGDHVHHLFVVRTAARDALRKHLEARGIATAVHYPQPIHRTEAYAHLGMGAGTLPVCERLAGEICTLPLWPGIGEHEVARIAGAIHDFDSSGEEAPWKRTSS